MTTFEPKTAIYANNKTSAKLSWKRKEAINIAQSIHRWFEDKGFYLPASIRTIFGRAFKTTETTKQHVSMEVMKQHDLRNDPAHLLAYQAHVAKHRKAGTVARAPRHYLTFSLEAYQDFTCRPAYKACKLESKLPYTFDDFTRMKYLVLKKDLIRKLKKEHEQNSVDKALRFFTDRETGECFYDEYVELARAYYTLRASMPAVYALFKHPGKDFFQKQLVAMSCSTHRLDPVWNYKKSKLIRGLWYRFLQKSKVHEHYQPMHLMLTVPHKDGHWMGKRFYASEFIKKFNVLRKYPEWNQYIYGGEYGIEVTRKGASGLHIHMHCLVFQKKQYTRDEVNAWIHEKWNDLTGAEITWYETLYVNKKDESGKYIMDESAGAIPVLDKSGSWTDEVHSYSMETAFISGKRKKFYLDESEPWFAALTADEKLKHYCDGVMECIKYHFKTDCFKDKSGEWDIDLMKDVLMHSRKLRMYSKFGAFYREKSLNYSKIEKPQAPEDLTAAAAEGISPIDDGVAGRLINPFTKQEAEFGTYSRILSVPELQLHAKDTAGNIRAPVDNQDHEAYYKIKHDMPITRVVAALMRGTDEELSQILIQSDFDRFKRYGWKGKREKVWV